MAIQTRGFGLMHNRNKLNEAVLDKGIYRRGSKVSGLQTSSEIEKATKLNLPIVTYQGKDYGFTDSTGKETKDIKFSPMYEIYKKLFGTSQQTTGKTVKFKSAFDPSSNKFDQGSFIVTQIVANDTYKVSIQHSFTGRSSVGTFTKGVGFTQDK